MERGLHEDAGHPNFSVWDGGFLRMEGRDVGFGFLSGGVLIAYWGRDIKCQKRGRSQEQQYPWGGEPKAIPSFLRECCTCNVCLCVRVCVLEMNATSTASAPSVKEKYFYARFQGRSAHLTTMTKTTRTEKCNRVARLSVSN